MELESLNIPYDKPYDILVSRWYSDSNEKVGTTSSVLIIWRLRKVYDLCRTVVVQSCADQPLAGYRLKQSGRL